jgi:hypothetical protein
MKYLLLTTAMAIVLAAQPVQAEDAAKSQDANKAEALHAPTNRIGDMVPTMTAPSNKDDAAAKSATGENSAETIHAPTNRVGDAVPTMKSAENKDERSKSTTTGSGSSSN